MFSQTLFFVHVARKPRRAWREFVKWKQQISLLWFFEKKAVGFRYIESHYRENCLGVDSRPFFLGSTIPFMRQEIKSVNIKWKQLPTTLPWFWKTVWSSCAAQQLLCVGNYNYEGQANIAFPLKGFINHWRCITTVHILLGMQCKGQTTIGVLYLKNTQKMDL